MPERAPQRRSIRPRDEASRGGDRIALLSDTVAELIRRGSSPTLPDAVDIRKSTAVEQKKGQLGRGKGLGGLKEMLDGRGKRKGSK